MDSDFIDIMKFIMGNLNGLSEFFILLLAVYLDTILGNKWRLKNGTPRISKAALKGLALQSGLASFVLFTYLAKVLLEYLTHEEIVAFDWISSISFYFIGKWMLISIIANAKLAGYTIPSWVENIVSDEIDAKKERGGINKNA